MTVPIFHIGYHKTATSWFQKRFYPQANSHHYVPRRVAKQALVHPSALRFDPETARHSLGNPQNPIICEEALCGHYESAGLNGCLAKDMAYRIRALYPTAQIVVFIRRQPDIIKAAYLQYLRRGGTFSARRFVFPHRYEWMVRHKPFKRPMFDLDHFDYRPLIRLYRELFGPSAVHVFPFEALVHNPKAFLTDYIDRLGIDVDLNAIDYTANNVSYRSGTMRLARLLNHLGASDVSYRNCAVPLLPKKLRIWALEGWNRSPLRGRKVTLERLLGPQTAQAIERHYAAANAELAAMLDLPLAELGYPAETSCPTERDRLATTAQH